MDAKTPWFRLGMRTSPLRHVLVGESVSALGFNSEGLFRRDMRSPRIRE
jgi:hypothetical protein